MAFNEKYVTVTGGGLHDGSSEANAWSLSEALFYYSAGDRVNVKAGTYTHTSTQTLSVTGSTTAPVVFRGYKTTIGDMDATPTSQRVEGTDIPLFTGSGGKIYSLNTNNYTTFQNFHFEYDNSGACIDLSTAGIVRLVRCRVINTNTGSSASALRSRYSSIIAISSYLKSNQNAHVARTDAVGSSSIEFISSVVEGGNDGANGKNMKITGCIFKNQANDAVFDGGYGLYNLYSSTFYNAGRHFINASVFLEASNCVFDTCGGYAVNFTHPLVTQLRNNAYHDSSFTSGRFSSSDMQDLESITLTSSPFVDAAGNDFTINSASNAYDPAFLMEEEGGTSYRDAGAVQHQSPSGGGGATVHPLYAN